MNLRDALTTLADLDGVLAVQLLTLDGLPVEMIGHGVRADVLAAEAAAVAGAALSAAERLMLGEVGYVTVRLPQYRLVCFPLAEHAVAMVIGEGAGALVVEEAAGAIRSLREALAEAV